MVRIPQITSVETVVKTYYKNPQLGNKEIEELFGHHAKNTITQLKKMAKKQMQEENIPVWNANLVNTSAAYRAWGLDISDLEMRHEKIKHFD